MLPAGFAPATVSFEASRADLLRYGSVNCDLKVIRPRATELLLTPSFCRRPAVDSGDGPALKLNAGSGRKWMPHLESHQDLRIQSPSCYCCTTGQKGCRPVAVRFAGMVLPADLLARSLWRLLGLRKCLSGYRCCPGLGLFTKEVPMLLGQAGVRRAALILGSPGVAPGLHRLRVGCTVCQYAEPVK